MQSAEAGLATDTQSISTKIQDITKAEIRSKMKEITGQWKDDANRAIATENSLSQAVSVHAVDSAIQFKEWPSLIPENVQPKLKLEDVEDEPRLEDVQKEVEKVVFVKTKTPQMRKLSRNQQDVLLLKVASYGYAAANKSLEISAQAYEENDKMREEIEKTTDHFGLFMQMAKLELVTMRKQAELLHLHSRLLEASSAAALVNMEEPKDLSNISLAGGSGQTVQ